MSEHAQQKALIEWYRFQYPRLKACLFAIPNGAILCDLTASKRIARMGYLMDEGFKKGVSDLFLAVPRGDYHGLFLEMKDQGKTISALTSEQWLHIYEMRGMGYAAHWAAGFDQGRSIIRQYMEFDVEHYQKQAQLNRRGKSNGS